MADYRSVEQTLLTATGLTRRPIAVAYRDAAPAGVTKFSGTEPSGCSFWRLAAAGRVFYTVAADHYNCAVGSYTHNVPLPPERAPELEQTLAFMTGLGYLKMEEVPGIARLPRTPVVIVYAPLGETPVDPDVVLFAGSPAHVMLLQEAAIRAGVASTTPLLGRPTCMALPAALASGAMASSGCVGNRVYTGIGGDELYVAIPGRDLERIAREIATIGTANSELRKYHETRRASLATE